MRVTINQPNKTSIRGWVDLTSSADQIHVLLWDFSGVENSVSGAGLADTPVSDMGVHKTFLKEAHLRISCMHAVRFNSLVLQ